MEGKFAHWSAENATKAYLKTLKMGIKSGKEPDASEFISAVAAGNNAQLMVVVCGDQATAPSTLLALVAAANQTGGRVVCIFHDLKELQATKHALGLDADLVEYVIGDAKRLILEDCKEADFVLIDCKENHEGVLREMQGNNANAIVLGINAFSTRSWQWDGLRTQLLPIGEGLLMTRLEAGNDKNFRRNSSSERKSHWVVKVDRHTGEEHVFRVRCSSGKDLDG